MKRPSYWGFLLLLAWYGLISWGICSVVIFLAGVLRITK